MRGLPGVCTGVAHWPLSLFLCVYITPLNSSRSKQGGKRCTRLNKDLVGMVRFWDHRQLSAFFFFFNQCLEISLIWTEKSGKIHHEHQQSIYNEGLFISDHFFTAIFPGITPTCESQAQIHLKKCRFLVLTLQAFLFQETVCPSAILLPYRITFPFHIHIEQISETMAYFPFMMCLVLDFSFQVLRRKLSTDAMD